MALIEVRLRPTGPWRVGHSAGDRERVDVVYHSDSLYSAVTLAMRSLGWMEEWLDATARASGQPAVRFSSLFPFIGRTRLIAPPRASWPPATSGKFHLDGTRLIPLEVALSGVVSGAIEDNRWTVDGPSGCLVPAGAGAPFQVSMRSAAAIDRLTGAAEPHRMACLEFAPNAGWWGVFEVADRAWEPRVKSAFRLLADSGFGGERSRGWGRAGTPEFSSAGSLFPAPSSGQAALWWLLSLYSPHHGDVVDWTRGDYGTTTRGGWTDSPSGSEPKKLVRMMEEGSVLSAAQLRGHAVDVAPDGFAHPVYRWGVALAVPMPSPEPKRTPAPAHAPKTEPEPPPEPEPTSAREPEPQPTAATEPGSEAAQAETQTPESIPETPTPSQPESEHAPQPPAEPEPTPARTSEPVLDVETLPADQPIKPEPPPTSSPLDRSGPMPEEKSEPAPDPPAEPDPTPHHPEAHE